MAFDIGLTYRKQVYVLDYELLRQKTGGYFNPIAVPEVELYIPDGNPIFPLKEAAEHALAHFTKPSIEGETFAPLMLPFTPDALLGKRPRRLYITWKKILEIGPIPGCRGCLADSRSHTKDCVERFLNHYGEDDLPATHVADDHLPPLPISTSSSSSSAIQSSVQEPTAVHAAVGDAIQVSTEELPQDTHSTFCSECFERLHACDCAVATNTCFPCADPINSSATHVAGTQVSTKKRRRRGNSSGLAHKVTPPQGVQFIPDMVEDVLARSTTLHMLPLHGHELHR